MPRAAHKAIGLFIAFMAVSIAAVPRAAAVPFSPPAQWQATRADDAAVRSIAQHEPRRRIRRVPAEQRSLAPSNPAYGAPSWAGSCPAPYKEAMGACVRQCPGGFEDRGSFCNLIKGN